MTSGVEQGRDLLSFIDSSPSPYHACETAATRLEAAGFTRVDATASWDGAPSRGFVIRSGTLVAWSGPLACEPSTPFRLLGAHTDSPNLRIKPRPDTGRAGYRQLGVEVYGGALLNSWLDRDLGLSGQVAVRSGSSSETRLVLVDRPVLRVPQLAIHLDREINERGLQLNKQQHLTPVWGLGRPTEGDFRGFLAAELDVAPTDILAWDVMTHDLTPSAILGVDGELLAAPRIDNLASCWASIAALAAYNPVDAIAVACLYDHEEIGSQSATGADSTLLATVLERIVLSAGGDREAFHRAIAGSWCASVDGAHATHPNYAERHEPEHQIRIGGGPVIKRNSNERYATHADSEAVLRLAADRANVPLQEFVVRSDMACGSTIGPTTAARLGIATVDLGIPMLSMHSARELCGTSDPEMLVTLLASFLLP